MSIIERKRDNRESKSVVYLVYVVTVKEQLIFGSYYIKENLVFVIYNLISFEINSLVRISSNQNIKKLLLLELKQIVMLRSSSLIIKPLVRLSALTGLGSPPSTEQRRSESNSAPVQLPESGKIQLNSW